MFTYFLVAKLHCNAPDNNNCLSPIAEVKATSDDSAIGSSTIYDQSWDPKYSPPESPTKELPPVKHMSIESVFWAFCTFIPFISFRAIVIIKSNKTTDFREYDVYQKWFLHRISELRILVRTIISETQFFQRNSVCSQRHMPNCNTAAFRGTFVGFCGSLLPE